MKNVKYLSRCLSLSVFIKIVLCSLLMSSVGAHFPALQTRNIEITLTEGTNIAAALSPDGSRLAIDLLGRIWVVPFTGGAARALTDPWGDARQPSWSPDGQRIAFQAYWQGNWHIYTIHQNGSDLRQHTHGYFDHREPHWSPDGEAIAFSSDRNGNYDIWAIDLQSGKLTPLTQLLANEFAPAWSPDGEQIAYASDQQGKSGIWLWSKATQHSVLLSSAPIEATHPCWSPDGQRITFNLQESGANFLAWYRLADKTVIPHKITTIEEDHFPFRAAWISAGELIYTAGGKIRRRKLDGTPPQIIPFEATVQLERHTYPRRKRNFDTELVLPVKGILQPRLSPDGSRLVFGALADLWIRKEGQPAQRLTENPFVERSPCWSPDGKALAYISDAGGDMAVWIRDLESGRSRQIGPKALPGLSGLSWSPDGIRIALTTGAGPRSGQLWLLDLKSGALEKVGLPLPSAPGEPNWLADGQTVALSVLKPYSTRFREGLNRVLLLSADGRDRREQQGLEHWSIGNRQMDGPQWSPDGRWMAFISAGLLWILPVDPAGQPIGPPKRLTNELADQPSWSGDSQSLLYIATDRVKRIWINTGSTETISIDLQWSRKLPTSRTVVQAGFLFTGRSDQLQKARDIILEGHRIVAIEAHDPDRPADRIIDARDAYVMPGLIDMHSHQGSWDGEKLGRTWLAWGITSTRDATTDPYDALNRREARESGLTRGPRIFFTGPPIDGNRIYYNGAITQQAPAQLELELNRAEKLDYDLLKTYVRLPDALQLEAVRRAHQIGIPVTSHELYPAVAYGTDGVEHVLGTSRRGYSPKVSTSMKSYRDVIDLLAASGMSYTPTVGIYGAYSYLLAQDSTILTDRRTRQLAGPGYLADARSRIQQVGKDPDYWAWRFTNLSRIIKDASDAGVHIIAGTDSPIIPFGLALHLELEAYVAAGLTPFQALQTATINAAETLQQEAELGTIEAGKLADLIIVEKNPLVDIRHVRQIRLVIQNGLLHTLDSLLEKERN